MTKYQATCKWFNDKKGFGFITLSAGPHKDKDAFVHYSNINAVGHKALKPGQKVTTDILASDKGLKAVDVTPAA